MGPGTEKWVGYIGLARVGTGKAGLLELPVESNRERIPHSFERDSGWDKTVPEVARGKIVPEATGPGSPGGLRPGLWEAGFLEGYHNNNRRGFAGAG